MSYHDSMFAAHCIRLTFKVQRVNLGEHHVWFFQVAWLRTPHICDPESKLPSNLTDRLALFANHMLSIRQTAYFHQPDGQIQSRHNPHELLYPPATQLTSTPTSTDSMLAHGETVTQCSAHNPQPPLLAVARGVERHHESTFLKTSARRSPPLNLNVFGREATLKGNKLSFF